MARGFSDAKSYILPNQAADHKSDFGTSASGLAISHERVWGISCGWRGPLWWYKRYMGLLNSVHRNILLVVKIIHVSVATSPSHPQSHESRDKPLSHSVWFLPRHLNQAQQLLHSNVQCWGSLIFASKSCFLEHSHRLSGICGIVEKLNFCENTFEGFDA